MANRKFFHNILMSEGYKSQFEPMNLVGNRVKFIGWYDDDGIDSPNIFFNIYLGNRLIRRFDDATLPDLIKVKIAMIGALQLHDTPPDDSLEEAYWGIRSANNLTDVGYSIDNRSYYALIVTEDEFKTLRGSTIEGQS